MNDKELGTWGEKQAERYFKNKGYTVIERNFRCPVGEIDIIVKDREWIVFVEVKTRRSAKYGYPAEAVNYRKQAKYIQTAIYYLKKNKLFNNSYRFDIIEVKADKKMNYVINHIINAFQSTHRKYFF